jgi:hypothetical protein
MMKGSKTRTHAPPVMSCMLQRERDGGWTVKCGYVRPKDFLKRLGYTDADIAKLREDQGSLVPRVRRLRRGRKARR